MIDFSEFALSPNESRAARNFLGLSQTQAATKSALPAHKLKRFETGNYVPDSQFLTELREFFEAQGYDFHDEASPGAKAKSRGDVFPAGVVGETGSSPMETDGSTVRKLPRPQTANLQFMRLSPTLESDQIDRIFDCIEGNEAAIADASDALISMGFLSDSPDIATQAKTVAVLRRLAENGLLYAQLMGREILPVGQVTNESKSKTVGDLLQIAMSDMQRAIVLGDKAAQTRRKGRPEPLEVFQALVG